MRSVLGKVIIQPYTHCLTTEHTHGIVPNFQDTKAFHSTKILNNSTKNCENQSFKTSNACLKIIHLEKFGAIHTSRHLKKKVRHNYISAEKLMDTNKIKKQPPAPLCDVFASPLAQLISLETFVSPALLPVQRNFRANTCTRVPCETFAIATHNTRKWCVNIVYTCMCV